MNNKDIPADEFQEDFSDKELFRLKKELVETKEDIKTGKYKSYIALEDLLSEQGLS